MGERIVLCVDDEQLVLLAMRHSLRRDLGGEYRIETASSGGAALDLIRRLEADGHRVAAVVSDWLMPGMNGDEFLRIVRSERSGLCLILLSGYADGSSVSALETELSLAAVFRKPCRTEPIAEAIRRCLDAVPVVG